MPRFSLVLLLLFATSVVSEAQFVIPAKPVGWTNDFEHLFTMKQAKTLDEQIGEFSNKTSIEIAIVTIPDTMAVIHNFDSLILAIHRKWGVGKKEKQNGIVIGISASLKKIRISNGPGIMLFLTDAETKSIIYDIMLPSFRKNEYYKGTLDGLQAIIKKLK